jgi:molybdenum cofactor cytidylyltransferase
MISAIILAAGASSRMGQPKMLLPWGKVTVLEHVISIFTAAGIEDIIVVVGAERDQMESLLLQSMGRGVLNKDYLNGEMLSSLQCGLRALSDQTEAALIGLGDQPQVEEETVRLICTAYFQTKSKLILPSFLKRRGHPWLVGRPLWNELLEMKSPQSPRDFMNRYKDGICYINVDSPSILADIDTPEDYRLAKL